MTESRRPHPRTLLLTTAATVVLTFMLAIAGAGMLVSGCFKPHIASGELGCAPAGKRCPDGFECGPGDRCFTIGQDTSGSGGAGAGGTGGAPGTGGSPGGTGGSSGVRGVGETCLIRNEGQADQSDTCDTGLLCMNDCASARCYRRCQTDGECPESACTRVDPSGAQRLCEVPFTGCNPQDTVSGGCGPGLGCWLVSPQVSPSGGDRTVCDCQSSTAGTGNPCDVTRDCFKGLVCPPTGSGPGAGFCRRICDPTVGCSSGGTCHPFGQKWGYCF